LYRSAIPTELNLPFLETLGLKSLIMLAETADATLLSFMEKNSINYVSIENPVGPSSGWGGLSNIPVGDDLVISAVRILSNQVNYPALVCCRSGKFMTGVVMGCLRKLELWSMTSILEEYRRMALFSSSSMQQQHEQFIELFDTDLITISEHAPLFLRNTD
jgi:tyrosine-protein phosphatase OCA1